MTRPRNAAAAALLAACAACIWSDVVYETTPADVDVPTRQDAPPTAAPPRVADPASGGQPVGDPGPDAAVADRSPPEPPLPPPVFAPPRPQMSVWLGLLMIAPESAAAAPGQSAVLRLTFGAGTRRGLTGVAELAAVVAAERRSPSLAGGSLRGALARVGASLEVHIEAGTTSFEVTCPPSRWQAALGLLSERMAAPLDVQVDGDEVARVRTEWLRAQAASVLGDPLQAVLRRILGLAVQSSRAELAELALRTPAEVALFQKQHYLAAGAVLALWVPGQQAAAVMAGAQEALRSWLDLEPVRTGPVQVLTPPGETGILWAEREGATEFALILPLPQLNHTLAAELMVLQECFTAEGLGGRFGAAIDEAAGRDVLFDASVDGDHSHLVLRSRAAPKQVLEILQLTQQALRSFHSHPPGREEIAGATARARLRLMRELGSPPIWLDTVTRLGFLRAEATIFEQVLSRLENPDRLDLASALPAFANTTVSAAVVGGQPPAAGTQSVTLLDDTALPGEVVARELAPAELEAAIAAAKPHLLRAVDAIGGSIRLGRVAGLRQHQRLETGVGAAVDLQASFTLPDRLHEVRTILATTIETKIRGGTGVEVAGRQSLTLPVEEIHSRLIAAQRHPLLLLAAYSRQEADYRLIALRQVGDREIAVVERCKPAGELLRLGIDTGSGLIREVEAREWRPDYGTFKVSDAYEDYRSLPGGLRAPFYQQRTYSQSDTPVRITTLELVVEAPAK